MNIITAEQAPAFNFDGVEFTGYAAPSRGSGELCAWQIRLGGGHVSAAPHTLDHDEVFLVTSGRLRFGPDGPAAVAGDCAIIPAGEPLQLSNPDDQDATAYVLIRAGFSAKLADGTAFGTPPWAA